MIRLIRNAWGISKIVNNIHNQAEDHTEITTFREQILYANCNVTKLSEVYFIGKSYLTVAKFQNI